MRGSQIAVGKCEFFVVEISCEAMFARNLATGEEVSIELKGRPPGEYKLEARTPDLFWTGDRLAGLPINSRHTRAGKLAQ